MAESSLRTSVIAIAISLVQASAVLAGLEVTSIGKQYDPAERQLGIEQPAGLCGGSTSVRNTSADDLEWKEVGYYQRNRDLGQVFTAKKEFWLDALVLRSGGSDAAILAGAPGGKVFIQFFEVTGEPRINDNGTPPGSKAKHGFSTNHRCDDFIDGVQYRPIWLVTGGVFPAIEPTRDIDGKTTGGKNAVGKWHYLRWKVTGKDRIKFEAGKRYAFMVGFEEPARERGFTLSITSAAGINAPPSLTDKHDKYHDGWGLRREGDGTLPPTMHPGEAPPTDVTKRKAMVKESLFNTGEARYRLSPTTDGYPDVDVYRDLEFYLEAFWRDPAQE